jgi:cytochrome c-type biogenesis protein CcmE
MNEQRRFWTGCAVACLVGGALLIALYFLAS